MSTATMKAKRNMGEKSVSEIIASARTIRSLTKARVGSRGVLGMSMLSGLLLWLSFTPVNASPLAWLAPLPLLLLVRIEDRTRWMSVSVYFGSLFSQLSMLQWMRLGDPTMYIAWWALSAYLATYMVAFVAISRVAVHRLSLPLVLVGPVVWTSLEYLRAHLLTGFAWYFLGHSQYRWLELIQISDLVGAYGVSFVIVMSAAALTLMVPHTWLIRLRLVLPSTGPVTASGLTLSQLIQVTSAFAVFVATLGYGYARRAQADFQPGPRIALIQGNFLASLREEPASHDDIYLTHLRLNARAVREQAEVIIWPEGMFRWPLLANSTAYTPEQLEKLPRGREIEYLQTSRPRVLQELSNISQKCGAAFLTGMTTLEASDRHLKYFNSVGFVTPETGYVGRYDKMHRVPFGEYVPLVEYLPFLAGFTPYADSSGLSAGQKPQVFQYKGVRYAPVVCYEDTVPNVVRRVVNETGEPDVLVNASNDGWFHGSSEHDQHLLTAVFRCVETRTPMVRAANMGVSAVIDGDGRVRAVAKDLETGASKACDAVVVAHVPLDPRSSVYLRIGDWPAALCAMLCGTVCLGGIVRRPRLVG